MLAESFRVLKPGGRFAVSDVLFQGDMSRVPQSLLDDVEAWSGCVAGALEERDYLARLRKAGFADAAVEVTNVYDGAPENSCCGAPELPTACASSAGSCAPSGRRTESSTFPAPCSGRSIGRRKSMTAW